MRVLLLLIFCLIKLCVQEDEIPNVLTKFIEKCSKHNGLYGIMNCITERSLMVVLKASEEESLQISPGFEIVRANSDSRKTSRMLSIHDLPKDPRKKQQQLMELLLNATSRFISASVLQIRLPNDTTQQISRAFEEGRGKKKKLDLIKLGFGAIMFTVVPIMLAAVGFISAKALVIAKIALVLSIVLFVQGLLSGGRNMLPLTYGNGVKTQYGYNPSPPYGYGTNSLGGWNDPHDGYSYL